MRWRDYTRACGGWASDDEPVDVCAIERRLRVSGLLKMAPESVVAPSMGVCTGMTSKTAPSLKGRTRPRTGTGACPYGSHSGWFQPPKHEIRTFSSGIPLGMPDPGKGELLKNPAPPGRIPRSSLGIHPAFARICGCRPASGCGRISRQQRRGDILMDARNPEKGKRWQAPHQGRPAGSVRQSFSRRSGPLFRARGPAAKDAPGISIKYRTIR